MRTFEDSLAGFLAAAQVKVDAGFNDFPGQSGSIAVDNTNAPRYLRIVKTTYVNQNSNGRSAYCFIDKTTGNVYKAAGWSSPETKNPRSNIYADDFGVSGVTEYGTVYLR